MFWVLVELNISVNTDSIVISPREDYNQVQDQTPGAVKFFNTKLSYSNLYMSSAQAVHLNLKPKYLPFAVISAHEQG